ncbi:MAG TPA: M20 family metallopeptidase [Acidimicrobiales bacterium]
MEPLSPTALASEAGAVLDDVVALRRDLHQHPELQLDLPRTQARVLEALDGLPLRVTLGRRQSSIVADLDGDRPGPTVVLRADMDALPMPEDTGLDYASQVPGVMHSCGHDAHTAMLVGAARLLADRRADLAGRVRLLFQPGEEGAGGAAIALDEGLLDGRVGGAGDGERVSWAFAIHQSPSIPSGLVGCKPGAMLASADELHIRVRGKGGHASMPHHANDPIPVACEIVQALQTWVTRRVDVFTPAVVTVARIRAGSASNVIPETATLDGTIRTVTARVRDEAHAGVRRIAEHVAAAHDMVAEVTIEDGYPVTVNDGPAAEEVLDTARWLVGEDMTVVMPTPVMGAEDFSYILNQVPGAMAFLGTRPAGMSPADVAPNHSNRMVLDEGAMATGVALYAAAALLHLGPEA